MVVAQLADVARAEAPGLTGNDRRCGLAAGQNAGIGVFGLGASSWEVGEGNQRIDCIETNAYEVDLTGLCHDLYFTDEDLRARSLDVRRISSTSKATSQLRRRLPTEPLQARRPR